MKAPRAFVWALAIGSAVFALLAGPRDAEAHAWMIRHGYTGCVPCHTDPSGAGPLTPLGYREADRLLSTEYGAAPDDDEQRAASRFLWGEADLPAAVRAGGSLRGVFSETQQSGLDTDREFRWTRADLYADVLVSRVRAAASLGYAPSGSFGAAITSAPDHNVLSREHWLGLELTDDGSWLVRAGRIAVPFGLRTSDDSLWVRSVTRTSLDADQEDGLSLSVTGDWGRAELMGILGNYQISPDAFRERGYSGYVELAPNDHFTLGLSSLFTRAERDIAYRVSDYRQAHGLFARYSPAPPLVVLAEGDWVYQSLTGDGHRSGYAAWLEGDWEPVQGLHFMLAGQGKNDGAAGAPSSLGATLSVLWFFLPHADLRTDAVYMHLGSVAGDADLLSWVVGAHLYL